MWTPDTRLEHDRDGLRYQSDLTGEEWQILAPPPVSATRQNRPAPVVANARSDQCDLLCSARRHSLAHAAGTLLAVPNGIPLVYALS